MQRQRWMATISVIVGVLAFPVFSGCSSNSSNPLAAFQPEIANNPDSFQFQATGTTNVSTTVEYVWQNSGTRATMNQSSAITGGSATLTVFGPDMTVRYTGSLGVNGTFQSDSGAAGSWRIRVTTDAVYGTLNFRVQKL